MSETIRTEVKLSAAEHQKVAARAVELECSVPELFRVAMDRFLGPGSIQLIRPRGRPARTAERGAKV